MVEYTILDILSDYMWSKDTELLFFKECNKFASVEQLFYLTKDNRYLAYWPKKYDGNKTTLQSRNSLIGNFSEKWTTDLIKKVIEDEGLHAIQGVQCDEIGLNSRSPADIVISTKNKTQLKPSDIKMIFEVKMSLVWNWEFNIKNNSIKEVGDYKTHQGNPGLLRSDSMLKAIGKCINIRVSDYYSSKIPLIVIGNTPISPTYYDKVDHLKKSGIIQGFWSINPHPLNAENTIKSTDEKGFIRFDNEIELKENIVKLLREELHFFSTMESTTKLGQIIEIANEKDTYEDKGLEFIRLIRGN